MLRKLFVLAEIQGQYTTYLMREPSNPFYGISIDGVDYGLVPGVNDASIWLDVNDVETFLMMHEQAFSSIAGGVFEIKTIYKWFSE